MWKDPHTRNNDTHTRKARKEGFLARSVYKLEELDEKFRLFDETVNTVLDIWCAPGSWLQYVSSKLQNGQAIGLDIKEVKLNLPYVTTYQQDITDRTWVQNILEQHQIEKFDLIISDMAPDTIWTSDIDAIRSIGLIEKSLWLYEDHLKEWGKFAIKIFMWPWFEEFVRDCKEKRWGKNIRVFKPKSCRKKSKETYVVKIV